MAKVIIYEHVNYQGTSQELDEGYYNVNDLGIGNDRLSSLRVPAGMQITLYEHREWTGRHKIFTQDTPYVGDDFNDLTSSIWVERLSNITEKLFQYEPVRLCGTIFRFNENPGEFRTSLDDQVRIQTDQFEVNFLVTNSPEVEAVLNSIRAPHDRFYGCVYGKTLPQLGFEGLVFEVDRIELIRKEITLNG